MDISQLSQQRKNSTKAVGDVFSNAAIATDSPSCSAIGRDILKSGGSAVDAAIATALALGVVNPQSSGIGGGMIMVVYTKDKGTFQVIDARETCPEALRSEVVAVVDDPDTFAPLLIGVPGEVAGMWEAHQKFGKLPWHTLFEPAIKLAEEGYEMTNHTLFSLKFREERKQRIDPMIVERYSNPDGSWKSPGSWIRLPGLGQTLRKLATGGPDVFYRGEMARALSKEIQDIGGVITEEDFAKYKARWVKPVAMHIKENTRVLCPPVPAAGNTMQLLMKIMKESGFSETDFESMEAKLRLYNRYIEAERLVSGFRRNLGDIDTNELQTVLRTIFSDEFAKLAAKELVTRKIDIPDKIEPTEWSFNSGEEGCTTHISIIAENGDAVSMTSTIGKYFGSTIESPSLGIVFNSHVCDFREGTLNEIEPQKRPLTAVCCSIVVDDITGDVLLVTGGAGARRIISSNAWIILRTMLCGIPLPAAVDEPRVYTNYENIALVEQGFPREIAEILRAMGHTIDYELFGRCIVNAVSRLPDGNLCAVADPRKGKMAAGY